MDRRWIIAIICSATLLAVPAASTSGDRPCRPPGEPTFDPGTRKRVWQEPLNGSADGGEIRVQAYRAGVHVTTWNRSAWRVEIAQHDPYEQLDADVEADDQGGSLRLQADVGPRDLPPELDPTSPDEAYGQIAVVVPAADYDRVEVDNRPGTPGEMRIDDGERPDIDWDSIVVDAVHAKELRLESHRDAIVGGVDADRLDVQSRDGSLDLTDVHADEIRHTSETGALCAAGVDAATLDVSLADGGIELAEGDLDELRVSMQSGRVDVGRVRADEVDVSGSEVVFRADRLALTNLSYGATGGSFDARIVPVASGSWSIDSSDAAIDLSVPAGDDHGYDVEATGHGRQPAVDLPGAETVESSPTSVHVRTRGHDDRPVRTSIDANGRDTRVEGEAAPSGQARLPQPPEMASVGLVAVVVAVAVAVLKMKGALAPLYTRLSPDEVRDHAVRQQIVGIVRDEPGIHFRELKRRVGAGRGILDHHLTKLVDVDLLDEVRGDAYRCYFPGGEVDRRVMAVADRLRADGARAVLTALRDRPSASLTDLADAADLSSSTAGYHLDRLREAGLLTKERRGGRLAIDLTDLGALALDQLELG